MEFFSVSILLLAALFLWWVIKERGRNERERHVSVELVNRLFRLDERILKLEAAVEHQSATSPEVEPAATVFDLWPPASSVRTQITNHETALNVNGGRTTDPLPSAQSHPTPMAARSLPEIQVSRDSADAKTRSNRPQSSLYVTGRSIPANGAAQARSLIVRNTSLGDVQPEALKLGELGMAALLCGIALLMDGDSERLRGATKN
jgi:hypothetical protein